jgi:ubiquinone/menaquinone biosynthesis C-methylase UbiE
VWGLLERLLWLRAANVFDQTVLEALLYIRLLKALGVNSWRQKRSVMRRYNLTAQMYDARYCEEQEAKYHAALENFKLGDSVVLDVGCGSGLFFSHVADKAATVVGVDVSLGLLQLAKERAKKYPNVSIVQADADHLPFKQEVVSHVFAFTLLQNMPNPAETLKQFKVVAKREGVIVVTGLKAAIPMEAFGGFLEAADLQVASLSNNEELRCYVLTCVQRQK